MYYSAVDCTVVFSKGEGNGAKACTDLYALQVDTSDGVMPYHSWSNREAEHFIDGQIIVQGSLILNSNIPNYINRLISNTAGNGDYIGSAGDVTLASVDLELSQLHELLTEARSDGVEVHSELVDLGKARLDFMKKVQNNNIKGLGTSASTKEFDVASTDLVIHNNKNSTTDTIYGVKFTGKSYELAGTSGQNCKYAFPFVAKNMSI